MHSASALLRGLSAAVLVIDQSRIVLSANRAAEDMFGQALEGRNFIHLLRHPECIRAVNNVFDGHDSARAIMALAQPTKITYQLTVVSLEPAPDQLGRAVVSLENISHIQEAELMRSDFVANVSHELRSPLTALSGFVETMKGTARNDPAAQERFLDLMEREAERMTRLIDDLLSLSRVEVNEHVRPSRLIEIAIPLRRVVALLEPQAVRENRPISVRCENEELLVSADEDELTQLFQNLIENALKYGDPDTPIDVELGAVARVVGVRGPAAFIRVIDRGPGISADDIPRLTERFYRVEKSRSRLRGGTGLGLSIVKHIVSRHRGRLTIESTLNQGSTFTAFLPEPVTANLRRSCHKYVAIRA